jgi:hypothetical protein
MICVNWGCYLYRDFDVSISSKSLNQTISTPTIHDDSQFLLDVQLALKAQSIKDPIGCWSDDYTGSRDDYLKHRFDAVLNHTAVLVYPFCAKTFQLGNTLGYYLNDLGEGCLQCVFVISW